MSIIKVENLTKVYKVPIKSSGIFNAVKSLFNRKYELVNAINNVNFSVEQGEIIGYLGPNGSGKTTTLKLLSGLLHPASGTVKINGFIPWERNKEFLKMFAIVMGQRNQLWWDLPAHDSFELFRAIYEVDKKEYKRRLEELVNIMDIKDILNKPVRNLSLGERMKLELIGAMLHKPKILFLDEPTLGLDVIAQRNIRTFLKNINKKHNVTIILTSHYMKDIEQLCDRVIIINDGNKIFDGDLDKIKSNYNKSRIFSFSFEEKVPDADFSVYGELVEKTENKVILKIPVDQIRDTTNKIFSKYIITNYSIKDEDIDNIISYIFENKDVVNL